jgi:hypothetical protein
VYPGLDHVVRAALNYEGSAKVQRIDLKLTGWTLEAERPDASKLDGIDRAAWETKRLHSRHDDIVHDMQRVLQLVWVSTDEGIQDRVERPLADRWIAPKAEALPAQPLEAGVKLRILRRRS